MEDNRTATERWLDALVAHDCISAVATLRRDYMHHDIDEHENTSRFRMIEDLYGVEAVNKAVDKIDAILDNVFSEII